MELKQKQKVIPLDPYLLLIVLHGIETTYPRTPAYFLPFNCTTTHRLFDTKGLQMVVNTYYDVLCNKNANLNQGISEPSISLACVCKLEKDRMVFKSWYELKNPKVRSGILIFRK